MKMSPLLINRLFLFFGILCILYYLGMGLAVRFGQSLLWVWLVLGIVCIARFFLARNYVLAGLPFPMAPRLIRGIRIVIAVGLACFLAMECVIASGAFRKPPKDLDAIIVLGALVTEEGPSGALRQRIAAADAYIYENPDVIVVASGGQGDNEPISEAACIAAYLDLLHNPRELIVEDQSADTEQNIRNSLALLDEDVKTVGIVTSDFHVFRSLAIARKMGGDEYTFYGVPARSTAYGFIHYAMREVPAVMAEAVQGNLSF